jgi:4a-hydroxytetrahydrobiopterin dehydratase
MSTLPTGWSESKEGLKMTFVFKNFVESLAFVNQTGKLAEAANHHPDIDIRWNKVHLTLITHDAGNKVTKKDRDLAEKINKIKAKP